MRYFLLLILFASPAISRAQRLQADDDFKRNNVKINLSSLLLNNYSISWEHSFTKAGSLQLGYRYQPYGSLLDNKLGKIVKSSLDIDENTLRDMESYKMGNYSFTGEYRFYGGRHPGARGFYFGVYGRYTRFDIDRVNYQYVASDETAYSVPLVSNIKGFGGGLLIGAQWLIKNTVSLDFYIMGCHYGKLTGTVNSHKDLSGLSTVEKAGLKQDVESLLASFDKSYLSVTVNDDGLKGQVNGPFAGIRAAGLSIGFAF